MRIMTRIFALTLMLFASYALGQDKPKDTAPVIGLELRAKLFKARAEQLAAGADFQRAQATAKEKDDAWAKVANEAMAVCGAKYTPQFDRQTGDPICSAIPEPPAPAAKPKDDAPAPK